MLAEDRPHTDLLEAIPDLLTRIADAKYAFVLCGAHDDRHAPHVANFPSGFPGREYARHLNCLMYGSDTPGTADAGMRWLEDVEAEPDLANTVPFAQWLGYRACVLMPVPALASDGKSGLGAAGLLFAQPRPWRAEDAAVLQAAAAAIGLAMSNLLLRRELEATRREAEEQLGRDALTEVASRRLLFHYLPQEIATATRYRRPLSCLMIDVDGLKRINDTWGHQAGDLVLREVAQAMARSLRCADVIARYGGDEFFALLPDTDSEGAAQVAARLLRDVRRLSVRAGDGPVEARISIGAATYYGDGSASTEALIQAADSALYDAKQAGGDQQRSAPSAPLSSPSVAPAAVRAS